MNQVANVAKNAPKGGEGDAMDIVELLGRENLLFRAVLDVERNADKQEKLKFSALNLMLLTGRRRVRS